MEYEEDAEDIVRAAHARTVIRHHPWGIRRGEDWRWWAPWRLDVVCQRCLIGYPCPSLDQAHRILTGGR